MALTNLTSVHHEPACEHNQAKSERERKAGCPKAEPGNVAGGCAFDGAMITLVPVADVAHVVHGPIGCCGNSWDSRGSLSSGPDLYRRGFATDLAEHDIVFGSLPQLDGEQAPSGSVGTNHGRQAPGVGLDVIFIRGEAGGRGKYVPSHDG